ncbi:MAG: multidrug efflux SMR transporter, partial [Desulfovibrionaceae bacterium]|nr:multidrug efflux SMR transporter [Desulfovibrionaceae bacterium]
MAWILLFLAGLLEIGWAVALKFSHGLSRPLPTVVTLVLVVASFLMLSQAMRDLPMGTSYAVWTGIGSAGTAIVGMIVLALLNQNVDFRGVRPQGL